MSESKSFIQTLKQKNYRFEHATTLEDVLCFVVLASHGLVYPQATVDEARAKWLEQYNGDCYQCPCCKTCVACIINE